MTWKAGKMRITKTKWRNWFIYLFVSIYFFSFFFKYYVILSLSKLLSHNKYQNAVGQTRLATRIFKIWCEHTLFLTCKNISLPLLTAKKKKKKPSDYPNCTVAISPSSTDSTFYCVRWSLILYFILTTKIVIEEYYSTKGKLVTYRISDCLTTCRTYSPSNTTRVGCIIIIKIK